MNNGVKIIFIILGGHYIVSSWNIDSMKNQRIWNNSKVTRHIYQNINIKPQNKNEIT